MCTAGTGEALIQMTAGKMTREGVVQAMKATPLKVVVDNTNGDDLLHPERAIPGQEISLPQGKHVYFIPNPATPTAKS